MGHGYTLIMNFRTSKGNKISIELEGISPYTTDDDVNELMDKFVNLDLFDFPGKGELVSKISSTLLLKSYSDYIMYDN